MLNHRKRPAWKRRGWTSAAGERRCATPWLTTSSLAPSSPQISWWSAGKTRRAKPASSSAIRGSQDLFWEYNRIGKYFLLIWPAVMNGRAGGNNYEPSTVGHDGSP